MIIKLNSLRKQLFVGISLIDRIFNTLNVYKFIFNTILTYIIL